MSTPQTDHLVYGHTWLLGEDIRDLFAHFRAEHRIAERHFIAYGYVDATAGLSLALEAFYAPDTSGQPRITFDLTTHKIGLRVRYDTFPHLNLKPLPAANLQSLNLPLTPEWASIYARPDLEPLRQRELLHPLRAPGFPDDIATVLYPQNDRQKPEQVWVRMVQEIPESRFRFVATRDKEALEKLILECVLLNQPQSDYGLRQGQAVMVAVRRFPDSLSSWCLGALPVG